jgi:hypothetical protein
MKNGGGTVRWIRFPAMALGLLPLWFGLASAQSGSQDYLPSAEAIGEGWSVIDQGDIEVDDEAFSDGAKAVYGGPNGARAIVFAYRLADASAIRRSWEVSTEWFETYASEHAEDWFWDDEDLVGIPAPDGCADIKRAEGPDGYFDIPTGVVLCAIDPDAVLIALASGEVAGETGYRAADAVIEAALAEGVASASTPTP